MYRSCPSSLPREPVLSSWLSKATTLQYGENYELIKSHKNRYIIFKKPNNNNEKY